MYFKNISNEELRQFRPVKTQDFIMSLTDVLDSNLFKVEDNDGIVLLDDKVKIVLEYRKKYPESSLKELAEIISIETNKPITKSGLNHRLRKIKDLANKFKKMSKED